MKVLVTGTAGFIGANLAGRLLGAGHEVIGVDNLSPYYDVALKEARLARLIGQSGYLDVRADIADRDRMMALFAEHKPSHVVNLAAQAGVRYSLKEPFSYTHSNIDGLLSLLEAARAHPVAHFVFASSSSVYGANRQMPYSEHKSAEHPLSLYAATKKANELMAHTYAHLFAIPTTGLRFFTVYGPWGRPDMAPMLFADAILAGRPINVFNHGEMRRDFTYVDDIVAGIEALLPLPPEVDPSWDPDAPDPATSGVAPYRILNIGKNRPEALMEFIETLEKALGREAIKNLMPMQAGDVPATWADSGDLMRLTGYAPETPLATGIARFVEWYVDYFRVTL
ncbi:NAD-dependent epimerase [Consotaella salsifontis]|uniref:UDP-glucuronate 4-epimerase n=1 Tax=Consotaella salsifontis TaxID=1365950 RepID=A0A1T4PMQ8_9HYPH|nr:NAD-dependent epimerase [Consotaella salsifontis]SJZ92865.1 UDP-glucuronate 4-epimerase [Consotaella salsifontis]